MYSLEERRVSAALKSTIPDLRESAIRALPWYARMNLLIAENGMLRYQVGRGDGKSVPELHGFDWREGPRRSRAPDMGSNGAIEKIGMQEWFSLPEGRQRGCMFP
jgi:hypothetical protein